MRDHSFIRHVLHRRDLLNALGLIGTSLVVQGCLTQGDVQSLVNEGNINKLIGGSSKFSAKDEMQIGTTLYGPTIDQSGGKLQNPRVQKAMQDFCAPLFKGSPRSDLPWEVTVLEDNTVNAWALPAGKIGVNKGLLRYVSSDSELASVVGHEMGHVEKSHAIQAMNSESFTKSLTDIGKDFAMSKASTYTSRVPGTDQLTRDALEQIQAPLVKLVTTGYSRSNEFEADQNILALFGRTGHDPQKSYTFFETLLKLIPPDTSRTTSLYSTHPETQDRIAALKTSVTKMPAPTAQPTDRDAFGALKRAFPTRYTPVELPSA